MSASTTLLIGTFLLVLFLLAPPLGNLLARLIDGTPLPKMATFEGIVWRGCGGISKEMNWREYAIAILLFNLLGITFLFVLLSTHSAIWVTCAKN